MGTVVRPFWPALILHEPKSDNGLRDTYCAAFARATELYVVSAYLTEWNDSLEINRGCKRFRLIVGKDFGITRKAACKVALDWLPPRLKGSFLVADGLGGFHPKAVFWKEKDGKMFAIVGSSNLTNAAFAGNYEANIRVKLSKEHFERVKEWIGALEIDCVPVSEDWLETYKEADLKKVGGGNKDATTDATDNSSFDFPLPTRIDARERVAERRAQLKIFEKKRQGLLRLFRRCADGEIESLACYEQLGQYWGYDVGDRLQGKGFEIKGKHANYRELSDSILKIIATPELDRDDVVKEEIDSLAQNDSPVRGAFLSEMLCLLYPAKYPVLNKPIRSYLKRIRFRAPRRASEGVRYIDLASKLRRALRQHPEHPAKNLAELDCLIWERKKKRVAKG